MPDESKIVLKDGTTIKITGGQDKKFSRVSIYEGNYKNKDNHSAIHINVSSEEGESYIREHGTNHSDSSNTDIDCYITTACMKWHLVDFDDNCYELRILRWFRDNYVSNEDIEYYYMVAPMIVNAINYIPNNEYIYYYIYENIIEYCINKIIDGDYDLAYDRYRDSVLSLEKAFIGLDKNLINNKDKKMIYKI